MTPSIWQYLEPEAEAEDIKKRQVQELDEEIEISDEKEVSMSDILSSFDEGIEETTTNNDNDELPF